MSTVYYIKMERGDLSGESEDVLRSVARALRLSAAEEEYLHVLAAPPQRHPGPKAQCTPGVRRLLAAMEGLLPW